MHGPLEHKSNVNDNRSKQLIATVCRCRKHFLGKFFVWSISKLVEKSVEIIGINTDTRSRSQQLVFTNDYMRQLPILNRYTSTKIFRLTVVWYRFQIKTQPCTVNNTPRYVTKEAKSSINIIKSRSLYVCDGCYIKCDPFSTNTSLVSYIILLTKLRCSVMRCGHYKWCCRESGQ